MSKIINIIDNEKATEKKLMNIETQDKLKTHNKMIARIPNISIIILNTNRQFHFKDEDCHSTAFPKLWTEVPWRPL